MTFLIGGANSDSGAYQIDNSLRFNKADSAKLSFTQGTPTSRRTWTYSTWVKRGNLADQQESILSWGDEDFFDVRFQDGTPDDGLLVYISDGDSKNLATNRLFRDPAAWYHIIVASDTTDGTAGDRTRIYVNGVEETVFTNEAQPDQNYDYRGLVSGDPIVIGNRYTGSHYLDGYLADTHFIDGQQLTPSSFGETNDNGVWIPIKYSGTYGTNGFKLEYKQTGTDADASGLGADTSGNTNHLTPTNLAATDVTVDTPTNNFATLNPLNKASNVTLSEGNCKAAIAGSGQSRAVTSSIAVSSGKWYWETKYTTDVDAGFVGVITADGGWNPSGSDLANNGSDDNVGYINGGNKYINGSATSYGDSWGNGDTISVLLNIDDNEVIFYKDGTAQNSGTAISKTFSGFYYAVVQHTSGSGTSNFSMNFGNPPHSISSGNADANGYGNFEFAVPSGYYALCTKNLAEFG